MNHNDSQLARDVLEGDVDDAVRVLLDRVHTGGACVGTDVPQKWFPRAGFTDAEYDQYAAWACRECPVQAPCLTYAVRTGQTRGVWGGLAEHRLRELAEDDLDSPATGGHGHPATGIDTTRRAMTQRARTEKGRTMTTTSSPMPMEDAGIDHLVEQAEHAGDVIRLLINRTGSGGDDVLVPWEVAEVIAALAVVVESLPQLLGRLASWAQIEQHAGRLRVDDLAALPDPGQTVHALSHALHQAIHGTQAAAGQLHTAHEHAAHLAPSEPTAPPVRGW